MDALSKPFGTLHGVPVVGYYLENARGTRVCVLNLGGIVQDYSLRTDNGRLPLVIGYDNAADYVQNPFQINKQIWPRRRTHRRGRIRPLRHTLPRGGKRRA